METILIIDDEKSILDLLGLVFRKDGFQIKTCSSPDKVFDVIQGEVFDFLLCDIKMPPLDGMDVLRFMRQEKPEVPVVMMTAYGSVKQAVESLKIGALDYVMKPFDVEELRIIVSRGFERLRLAEENVLLKKRLEEQGGLGLMVGKSKAMKEIYSLIERVAGTDTTVLIQGESGTGKELAAQAIHSLSPRKERPFISINCAALPENLLESELFGHVRGAFTGAMTDKKGMFEVAHRGTLFLDEVAEMAPMTQVKLLRTLQERKIRRVGGTDESAVDVRIIAATNQDLKKRMDEGRFREELFYRLNVISFEMPPLRRKTEDIPVLVGLFLQKYCLRMGKKMKRLTPEIIGLLEAYPWPGNIRELENVIERIVAIEDRETITPACLPAEILSPRRDDPSKVSLRPNFNLEAFVADITKRYICEARRSAGGNLKKAASLLGISYRSLRYLIEKHKLKDFRNGNGREAVSPAERN
ncbi:MAG: Fis family transcriptional regulator [Candidatus Aminicenantes bacterium RBG_19FT_COMBO_58_17]|nr:MAG: Fis family transcriptional regulator [Candidatus Aminicenantes bacterium RBG_19FT_COMBO_58_17]